MVDNQVIAGAGLQPEHGLSFWIETENGSLLFDTGQTAAVLTHNLAALGISPRQVKLLALSHAHYDHTGGIQALLAETRPKIYATAQLFTPRYALRNGEYQSIGLDISQDQLSELAELKLSDEPFEILPGLWTTGVITQRDEPMGRNRNHFIRAENVWIADPYLDDMSLVMETEKGLVLICGCCHAGLLNTLAHVRRYFSSPIKAILGGVHLKPAEDEIIDRVINRLNKDYIESKYFLNHCTGDKALLKFSEAFTGRVFPCPAGARLDF